MIRCILVDDEPLALVQLQKYVDRVPFLHCVKACSCATEAMEVLSAEEVDVMFVDINMPDVNGLQLVRSLINPPLVVFTTAYSEYAIDGFKVDAIDYLLKPFSFEQFVKAANKVNEIYTLRRKASQGYSEDGSISDDCLFVKSDYRMLRIPVSSIRYIESMSEYVRIYVEGHNRPIVSLMSMKKIEDFLPSHMFMRVHRSYLVNLNKIVEVSRMRIVYDGDVYVPIGDMYKDKFFEYIDKHFVGKNS
ncbi:MAG: response regulator transcription factor [Bacteroidaceae bacterium]|nr:response regulator transcription factor [Bacteroidaceae bacterium]